MKIEFIPLDYDYVDIKESGKEKEIIRIWGKTKEGKRCCVIDSCDAFFWVLPKENIDLKKFQENLEKIRIEHAGRIARVIKTEIKEKKFLGKKVRAIKIFVNNSKDINVIKEKIKEMPETEKKEEVDINFITRYILEKNIKPLHWYSVEGEKLENFFGNTESIIVVKAKKFSKLEKEKFQPKVLAFDIEASEFEIGKGQIIMISISGKNLKKILTWKKFKTEEKQIEFVNDEKELIKKFLDEINKEKPDILVGYFSDGFDIPYLKARAERNKIKLSLGFDKSNIKIVRSARMNSGKITGLVHIDLFKFISNIISPNLRTETLSLNDVASELLKDEKIEIDIKKMSKNIDQLKDKEIRKFCLYNLKDAILTEKLFNKLWISIMELTKIVSEPLFNISRSGYSHLVESYLIHNTKKFNEIIPNRPTKEKIQERRKHSYKAAFVLQPEFALYKNIAVFDFRSFWPNIIASFNISPETLQKNPPGHKAEVEIDNKKKIFYFKKQKALIPYALREIIEKRKKIKQELKKNKSPILKARDYAFKTLANATYGYFGFFGARWYCIECSASITGLGRKYMKLVMEKISKHFKVIYSDTDSVMFELGNKKEEDALEILKKINSELPGTMELELENFYEAGLFVAKRTTKMGAKKKYALLTKNGELKIRGFETIRRDWCELAKEVQHKILLSILKDGEPKNSLRYVHEIIEKIKKREISKEKLIIKTQLKKDISNYESIGPHVFIAKHMQKIGIPIKAGSLIEYIIAETKGKKLIREKAKLPDEIKDNKYDIDYYIKNQIVPAVENIFDIFKISKQEIIEGKKQRKLHEF